MQSFTFAMMLTMSTMAAPTLSTDISAFPWEVVSPATKDTYTTGNGALIGPKSDVVAIASGGRILQHNITTGETTKTELTNAVYSIWGAPGSSVAWAAGSPPTNFNGPGEIHTIDFNSPSPKWAPISLPFPCPTYIRDIHGTSADNVWAVAGSGEELRKTSIILHYDGKVWTKHLENVYIGADAVFARGNDVWVGHQNGQIIHSNDGFKTHMIIQKGYRGDFLIGQIRGGSSATSPIYIGGPDGLKVIKNPTCVPKKQFGLFGPLVPCQKVEHLAQVPDKGNSGYRIMALIGELPGMTEDQVYTAGYTAWGGLWNGKQLIQDKGIINNKVGQNVYTSLMVKDNVLYAVGNDNFIAKRRLI